MNKKQVILASTKPKFKTQLYMKTSVKGKNYLTSQIFFSVWLGKKKNYHDTKHSLCVCMPFFLSVTGDTKFGVKIIICALKKKEWTTKKGEH
jgi:hypothetical protein